MLILQWQEQRAVAVNELVTHADQPGCMRLGRLAPSCVGIMFDDPMEPESRQRDATQDFKQLEIDVDMGAGAHGYRNPVANADMRQDFLLQKLSRDLNV